MPKSQVKLSGQYWMPPGWHTVKIIACTGDRSRRTGRTSWRFVYLNTLGERAYGWIVPSLATRSVFVSLAFACGADISDMADLCPGLYVGRWLEIEVVPNTDKAEIPRVKSWRKLQPIDRNVS